MKYYVVTLELENGSLWPQKFFFESDYKNLRGAYKAANRYAKIKEEKTKLKHYVIKMTKQDENMQGGE